jgi:outer membrane murein-binding lipoprotein Lpp
MKNFPYKILIICILLPPICYILSLQVLETYFQRHESAVLKEILIRNNNALYEGRYTVKEEIYNNIGEYLSHPLKFRLGVRVNLLVKTADDRILYPTQWKETGELRGDVRFGQGEPESLNYVEVAAENFRILNEGIIPSVEIEIRKDSLLANGILLAYVLFSFLFLQRIIKIRLKEAREQERRHEILVSNYSEQLQGAKKKLEQIESKESEYIRKIHHLGEDKNNLSRDVDELIGEMEKLEAGLNAQRSMKEAMELETFRLNEELERLREKVRGPKKRKKPDITSKRFRVLYKNLVFSDRAVEGFNSLIDEFQLKAEEVIHKLNQDESLVPVKRKVFGKGGKTSVLEADFSYSGRIYFQRNSHSKIRIVSIGTKNTQEQDLAYIDGMK